MARSSDRRGNVGGPDVAASSAIHSLELPPGRVAPAWLVAPRSFLVDRITPDCEEIRLPAREFDGGVLRFEVGALVSRSRVGGGLERLTRRLRPRTRTLEEGLFIDLRRNAPRNWAHILTNHLPICFAIAAELGVEPGGITPLLPGRTPGHILRAAEIFGFEPICGDEIVRGRGVAFDAIPWTGIRTARHDWVQAGFVRDALARAGRETPSERPLPRRVFISRKDTRRLTNETEIAERLSARGFETLYAEDLPAIDQFRLLDEAEAVVAVHGAALAPLLYRSPASPRTTVVELFPAGHVTDVWRMVCARTGCRWVGVRGRLRPEHLRDAYALDRPFLRHSLQDFEVDPASIDRAFELLEEDHNDDAA